MLINLKKINTFFQTINPYLIAVLVIFYSWNISLKYYILMKLNVNETRIEEIKSDYEDLMNTIPEPCEREFYETDEH